MFCGQNLRAASAPRAYNDLQRYSQSRRTGCRRTERGLEVVLYGSSPLTFFHSAGNVR